MFCLFVFLSNHNFCFFHSHSKYLLLAAEVKFKGHQYSSVGITDLKVRTGLGCNSRTNLGVENKKAGFSLPHYHYWGAL